MALRISGPGVGLPPPQALYPVNLGNTPFTAPTNQAELPAGGTLVIPAGRWLAVWGAHSTLQYLDPVTNQWENIFAIGAGAMQLLSDGFSFRVANLSNVAYAATVSAAGSGYNQATATVTPSAGESTWQPIVGGAITGLTVVSGGSGYTMPPRVFIGAPSTPGVAATAIATVSGGAVTGFTMGAAGAGYISAPNVVIVADPNDPGTNIVNATATATVGGAGTLTAVLLVDFGVNVGVSGTGITLTVGGGGSGATAATTPVGASWTAAVTDTVTLQPAP